MLVCLDPGKDGRLARNAGIDTEKSHILHAGSPW